MYIYKSKSVQENEMHKILWEFEMIADQPLLFRRPNMMLINKKITYYLMDFTFNSYQKMKVKLKENEKIRKYLDLTKKRCEIWRW